MRQINHSFVMQFEIIVVRLRTVSLLTFYSRHVSHRGLLVLAP